MTHIEKLNIGGLYLGDELVLLGEEEVRYYSIMIDRSKAIASITDARNMKTYKMNTKCENCGHKGTREFEKGSTCSGYYECDYCGCRDAKCTTTHQQLSVSGATVYPRLDFPTTLLE